MNIKISSIDKKTSNFSFEGKKQEFRGYLAKLKRSNPKGTTIAVIFCMILVVWDWIDLWKKGNR